MESASITIVPLYDCHKNIFNFLLVSFLLSASIPNATPDCAKCPAGTEPVVGFEYKWWNTMPSNMASYALRHEYTFNMEESTGETRFHLSEPNAPCYECQLRGRGYGGCVVMKSCDS